jgi:hypothetical protein
MDASQNSGQNQNGQNNGKKTQLSWSQPIAKPAQNLSNSTPATQTSRPRSASADSRGLSQEPQTKSNTMRNLSIAVVAILVIGGIAWAIVGHKKSATDTASSTGGAMTVTTTGTTTGTGTSSDTQAMFSSGSLLVSSPQSAGLQVAVSHVAVQVPTWVVIYENYNGQPGNVLGAALFTSDRASGVIDLLRGTLPGQTYFAGEARDDGDHMFSMVNDPAIRDTSGNPIVLKFETK